MIETAQVGLVLNPTVPMMQTNPAMTMIPQGYYKSSVTEAEQKATEFMKKSPQLSVERHESCLQIYWDFRDVEYNSQMGKHKVKRFQPLCINRCCCWPLKKCCCSYQIPRYIENDRSAINVPTITISSTNCGFISAGPHVLGTYDIKFPSYCARYCSGKKPVVVVTKQTTNEQFTLKVEEHCLKNYIECTCPCLALSKKLEISKGGDATYSRTFCQAIWNCSTFNKSFYNKLDINFGNFIESDADKLLIYGAFIFYQEITNHFRGCPLI